VAGADTVVGTEGADTVVGTEGADPVVVVIGAVARAGTEAVAGERTGPMLAILAGRGGPPPPPPPPPPPLPVFTV